jgi:hypothetical protein
VMTSRGRFAWEYVAMEYIIAGMVGSGIQDREIRVGDM